MGYLRALWRARSEKRVADESSGVQLTVLQSLVW